MSVLDVNGAVFHVTPSIEQVLGYTVEEYLALSPVDLIHIRDLHSFLNSWILLVDHPGARHTTEVRLRHHDGTYRWLETVLVNLLDDAEVGGIVSIVSDISDRRSIDATDDDAARYDRLVQSNADVIGSITTDGTITWVSGAVREMLGFHPSDLIGHSAWEFIHPDDVDSALDRLSNAFDHIDSIDPITLRARSTSGERVPVEIAAALMDDETEPGKQTELIVSMRDVRWRQDVLGAV